MLDAGFVANPPIPHAYWHPELDVDVIWHGDDSLSDGEDEGLDYLDGVYLAAFKSKILPRIGPGVASSGNFLNRSMYWVEVGFALEPDRKHVETLLALYPKVGDGGGALRGHAAARGGRRVSIDAATGVRRWPRRQ